MLVVATVVLLRVHVNPESPVRCQSGLRLTNGRGPMLRGHLGRGRVNWRLVVVHSDLDPKVEVTLPLVKAF